MTEDVLFATGRGVAPWMASVTFGGPDLQTVYIGSLRGSRIPYFRAPVPGLPMVHWKEESSRHDSASTNVAANYIGGEWRRGTSSTPAEIRNPATAEVAGEPAARRAGRRRRGCRGRVRRVSRHWRRTPPQERIQYLFQVQAAPPGARRRDRAHHHHGERQDAGRGAGRAAARHRERRGRVRHPDADAGLQPRGRRQRHRRDHDPPAARRHGRRSRRSTSRR